MLSVSRYNIRYGRVTADDTQVENAARVADIHDRIIGFTDGETSYSSRLLFLLLSDRLKSCSVIIMYIHTHVHMIAAEIHSNQQLNRESLLSVLMKEVVEFNEIVNDLDLNFVRQTFQMLLFLLQSS